MLTIDEIIHFIKSCDKSNIYDNNLDNYMETFYESILSSLLNKVKNDAGNYDELDKINKIKKDISKASRNQYKIIISYCKDAELSNFKSAFRKYNILHFFKFVIRILDIDEEYNIKVKECKKYFSNPEALSVYDYLYKHTEVPQIKFTKSYSKHLDLSSQIYDLIILKETNNTKTYSLSTKGKNLYAFFMMKNIDINEVASGYNEGKVNEVLEYLIQYVITQAHGKNISLNKPKLNSASADWNFNKLIRLLDRYNSYSQDFVQISSRNQESESFNWEGGLGWKIY